MKQILLKIQGSSVSCQRLEDAVTNVFPPADHHFWVSCWPRLQAGGALRGGQLPCEWNMYLGIGEVQIIWSSRSTRSRRGSRWKWRESWTWGTSRRWSTTLTSRSTSSRWTTRTCASPSRSPWGENFLQSKPNPTKLRLFWLDERVKHNTTTTQLEPLPRDPSTNKSYVLIKDSRDIDLLWKPDIFIDEAIKTRLVRVKLKCVVSPHTYHDLFQNPIVWRHASVGESLWGQ